MRRMGIEVSDKPRTAEGARHYLIDGCAVVLGFEDQRWPRPAEPVTGAQQRLDNHLPICVDVARGIAREAEPVQLNVEPDFDPLRREPRFVALLARIAAQAGRPQ